MTLNKKTLKSNIETKINKSATKTINWNGARDKIMTNAMETAHQEVDSGETEIQQNNQLGGRAG